MDFEFDPAKSAGNSKKHGIDFVGAQAIWTDDDRLEIPGISKDEPRTLVIGRIDGKHWTVVITYRGEKVRMISVRRSRSGEIDLYES